MRLSKTRCVVENVFGIFVMKWRIFLRSIDMDVEITECIVKAACYIMIKNNTFIKNKEQTETIRSLLDMILTNRKLNTAAFEIREQFVTYFNK